MRRQFVVEAGRRQTDDIVVVSADSADKNAEGSLDPLGARFVIGLFEGNIPFDLAPVHGKYVNSGLLTE